MNTNIILNGDALTHLKELPDNSINTVMTSPPYWALRDYGVEGQLGLEPTFDEYINKLCDIFDEVKRVLRKDGTCWVNLGDTYMGNSSYSNEGRAGFERKDGNTKEWLDPKYPHKEKLRAREWVRPIGTGKCLICEKEIAPNKEFCSIECLNKKGNDFRSQNRLLQSKSLTLIPMRFAIEMVNRGWILRNVIIWNKPNCMPSSVKDRFTVDFEYLFFFVKNKKYYFETQREGNNEYFKNPTTEKSFGGSGHIGGNVANRKDRPIIHTIGRNKRTVWTITTKGFPESHFAVYPEELCEIPIKAGCPEGGVVLDPFFGSGTTGLVALKQNKKFIGIELNPQYIEIAKNRLKPFLEQTKLI